jgi:hypothetical protein
MVSNFAEELRDPRIVGAVAAVENLKFPLEDGKQLLNIAMLLG